MKVYSNAPYRVTHEIEGAGFRHQFRYHIAAYPGSAASNSIYTGETFIDAVSTALAKFYGSNVTIGPGVVETPPAFNSPAVYVGTSSQTKTGTNTALSVKSGAQLTFNYKDSQNFAAKIIILDYVSPSYFRENGRSPDTNRGAFQDLFLSDIVRSFKGNQVEREVSVRGGYNRRLIRHYGL